MSIAHYVDMVVRHMDLYSIMWIKMVVKHKLVEKIYLYNKFDGKLKIECHGTIIYYVDHISCFENMPV